jgi:Signal peptide peptidase
LFLDLVFDAVPGLLVSFAARLDAAKALVVIAANSRSSDADRSGDPLAGAAPIPSSYTPKGSTTVGYYGPVVVAYGVGLFLANAAVYLMHMGQPALLYLVPCCLGTMMVLGYCRSELDQLWNGPFVLQEADAIAYGTRTPHTGSGGVGDGADNGLAPTSTTPLGTPDGAAGIMVELSFQQQSSSSLAADEDDEMGRVPLLGSLTASPSLGNNNNNHSGSS